MSAWLPLVPDSYRMGGMTESRKPTLNEAGLMAKIDELELQQTALIDRCAQLRLQISIMEGKIDITEHLATAQPPEEPEQ